jgi:hypothetical protein
MLTSGSSQRVQIRATTASTTTTRALVVSGGRVEGNVNVGGNAGITENVFVGGKMDIMGM